MTSTIRNTIHSALQASGVPPMSPQYSRYVDAVTTALELREAGIFEHLLDFATSEDLDPRKVEGALVEAGLQQPARRALSTPLGDDKVEELTGIRHEVAGLLERIDGILG